jgi:flagellar motor protein MotB
MRRAERVLRPPGTVRLSLENGTLTASGSAADEWLDGSRRIAGLIAGVMEYDDRRVVSAELQTLAKAVESVELSFSKATTQLIRGQEPFVERLLADAGRLDAWASSRGIKRMRLTVTGHTDADGSPESNGPLSLARAETLRAELLRHGIRTLEIVAVGAGSSKPLGTGTTEEDKRRNRRVSFTVEQEAAGR